MNSPRSLKILSAVFVGTALAVLLAPAVVSAQARAVVLDFAGGRNGAQARRAVIAALDGVVEVVPLDTVERTARAQHLDLATPEGAGTAARASGADLVISGSVTGRGARARTRLVVRDTAGRELASRQAGPPFGRQAQQALGDQVITMVQEAQNALTPSGGGTSDSGGDLGDTSSGSLGDDAEPDPGSESDGDDNSDHRPGAPPLLRAVVGLDARTRSAEVTLEDGGTRGYSAGIYPELMLAVEFHPAAHAEGALSGLFLGLEFGHSVGLSSTAPGVTDSIASSSLRFAAAVGWLIPIGSGVVALGPVLGGGVDSFTLGDNVVFASTSYSHLRLGVAVRVALAGDALALGASAGYRLVLGMGDIATAFGASGSAYGLDVGAELSGALDVGFAYGLRVGYESYGVSFDGGAGTLLGEGVDGSDSALRIQLLVGWQIN